MKVEVYRNLRTNQWSIRDVRTRKVFIHKTSLLLSDCSFHVNESGRQRVLRTKQKNVHAFVRGTISIPVMTDRIWRKARYNPYETDKFVDERGYVIAEAARVAFWADGSVWVA